MVGKNYKLFPKCRSAIHAALSHYNLRPDDVVSVFTTSGNTYISGCVTKAIEKTCKWSMKIEDNTKVIFVNHEFGYPYQNIEKLEKYGLPVIEDAAHAFFTKDENIGKVGDFVVYSLPKAFPMQLGGVLTSPKGLDCNIGEQTSKEVENYIESNYSASSKNMLNTVQKRIENYLYLKQKLELLGITPYFCESKISANAVVPSVFLFRWHDYIDYPKLKSFMQSNGVESSVFYGKNAFYIPCNDSLSKRELDYMIVLLEYFYLENYENNKR